MESILSNERECFRCGTTLNLEKHHVYGGRGRRDISEKYGCWVYLCMNHHTGDSGIHREKEFDDAMKRRCQRAWERRFGSREDFIKTFGRSYL